MSGYKHRKRISTGYRLMPLTGGIERRLVSFNSGGFMKQRNFVAKHSRSCGAGRHTVRTKYSRKVKHQTKEAA